MAPATTPSRPQPPRSAVYRALTAALIAGPFTAGPVEAAQPDADLKSVDGFTRPQVLSDDTSDVLVRVRGGATCSGTPITGGTLVVTAAHCVLDADGDAGSRTVLRDGDTYKVASILVNPDYHDSPSPRLDAAVLVMTDPIAGPSATIGTHPSAIGQLTLAGFQPLDSDGSLLRGTRHNNRPRPQHATGTLIEIDTTAAGCTGVASHIEITNSHLNVPCGLIAGASGGGLFENSGGQLLLVGIISTVAYDLTYNGVVPVAAVHELLKNPARYSHTVDTETSNPATSTVFRW